MFVSEQALELCELGGGPGPAPASAGPAGASPLDLDEAEMRSMMEGALGRVLAHLSGINEGPASDTGAAAATARSLDEPLPHKGEPLPALLGRLFDEIIPRSVNTAGGGYLGYIPGGGLFQSAVADFIAKSVNRYVGYWYMAPAVAQLEWAVVRWFCDMLGLPAGAGGVLTTGGSMANLTALIAARTCRLPERFQDGVIYLTCQTHYSVAKAAVLAGFPARCLRRVAVDEDHRMDVVALREAIARDRAAGLTPFLVVATAGTTGTGAIDPLDSIAAVAESEGLWLHVDGAYGGFFVLSEHGRQALRGIARADSVTLDPHKGLCLPYGTGALVVRDKAVLSTAFGARADYVPEMNRVDGEVDFCGLSMELSREWRGLRVWLPIKLHGIDAFRDHLEDKLALAREAKEALRGLPAMEVAASDLSIVAFRLAPAGRSDEELNELNANLLRRVNERQRVLLSSTRIDGRLLLRVAILSFRTRAEHLRRALDDIRDAARELLDEDRRRPEESIPGLFARRARLAPAAPALLTEHRVVPFAELDAAAERLARALWARGARVGDHVGVLLPRSIEAIIALLGSMKAGCAYVPLDPADPPERLRLLAEDASLRVVLTTTGAAPRAPLPPSQVLCLDALGPDDAPPPPARDGAPGPLYVLYTSGSTGRPKGVLGDPGATLNRLRWMWREHPFQPGEVYLHRTTLQFVDAIWEIFGPLLQGVPIVVLPPEHTGDPDAIAAAVRRFGVTRLTVVPSILEPLVAGARRAQALASAHTWISSGERLGEELLGRFRAAFPAATLLNLYGSTEVAGDVTCAAFRPGAPPCGGAPSIGVPIDGARLFVLDEEGRPVGDGQEGELYVGGPVLARGYHRRPDEQRQRFLELPQLVPGPVFRTGDRARREAGAVYHFLGRRDRQVKIRGVRIELDEVEAALLACLGPGAQGAVVARSSGSGPEPGPAEHVVAFVSPSDADTAALSEALAARLPKALRPSVILPLQALPLLPNGKVDRLRLRTLPIEGKAVEGSALERLIMSVWADLLPLPPTGPASDFHGLGGDSLALVESLAAIGEVLGREIAAPTPRPLTVAALARSLERAGPRSAPGAAGPEEAARGAEPLGGVDLLSLSPANVGAALPLLVESFSRREPMAAALGATEADLLRFAEALLERCLAEPLSLVAIERRTGRVVGLCLAHDLVGPPLAFCAERDAPRVTPLFSLLASLHARYADRRPLVRGQTLEMAATAAAVDVDGYALALELERQVLARAREHGFAFAMTLCTNAVTRHLAQAAEGMELLDEVPYGSFVHGGQRVFAAAARHRGVTLFEKALR